MGYNRSGRRFKDRIKRAKRLDARLLAKADAAAADKGIAPKVRHVAQGVVDAPAAR
jgi:hypothetical protein